ncbi:MULTISPECIES: sigma-54 interaction domain-containing protein [Bacillaceae]|uniref:sigma-54 interaction domain-containing protein n=1 Tax=Bacillaceae TaxID=186817 RepID=UPI000C77E3DD|nr:MULTISPECIES: sigma-54-dependent Fis family transcriptional regulator [Bacillaceae]PLR67534.1 sigma-54-dependent Fis family transcriptional regulator [Bacillus sp. UMB0893]
MKLKKKDLHLFFKAIIDEIDVGLHVIDDKGHTILYNNKMMQIESMDIQDVLDKNLLDVFMFTKDQDSTLVQALQKGTETKNVKQTYFNNKGKEITTINNTFPIKDQGKIIGAVEIAKDITKLERLIKDNIKRKGNTKYTFESIIGESLSIKEVIENAKRATRTSSSVLIVGETGTGKELFAQSIHNGSSRSAAPFISQNCAALPDNLIESLLFGTKKGAFSGAIDHPGLFEQAEGGTLLLDEINSLNPNLQSKLLRALQEKTIRRIGDTKDTPIDVRIIATINEDPIDAIANQRMRKDLYYRLSVVTIFVPPLRDRAEDIPLLVQSFIDKYNHLFQMDVQLVDDDVLQSFLAYDWPGNIRELEHMIEGAMNLIMDEEMIRFIHLPYPYRSRVKHSVSAESTINPLFQDRPISDMNLKEHMEMSEIHFIKEALKKNHFNISKTAKIVGISRQSLQYRIKKWGIVIEE